MTRSTFDERVEANVLEERDPIARAREERVLVCVLRVVERRNRVKVEQDI
jgi:hypothetical protein